MLNPDFAEMLRALSAAGAEFLIVGAYAMAAHGVPRATGDLDLWVRPTPENAARVLDALRAFGAPLFDLSLRDLVSRGTVFQLGLPPRRIDILTSIDGVTFERAWQARVSSRLGDVDVPVLGREELIRNKRAAGRPKDLVDLRVLMSARMRHGSRTTKATRRSKRPRR